MDLCSSGNVATQEPGVGARWEGANRKKEKDGSSGKGTSMTHAGGGWS